MDPFTVSYASFIIIMNTNCSNKPKLPRCSFLQIPAGSQTRLTTVESSLVKSVNTNNNWETLFAASSGKVTAASADGVRTTSSGQHLGRLRSTYTLLLHTEQKTNCTRMIRTILNCTSARPIFNSNQTLLSPRPLPTNLN